MFQSLKVPRAFSGKDKTELKLGVHEIWQREKQSDHLSCGHTKEYDNNTLKQLQQEEQGDWEISWVPVLYKQKDWGSHSKATQPSSTPNLLCVEGMDWSRVSNTWPGIWRWESSVPSARPPSLLFNYLAILAWCLLCMHWCPSPLYLCQDISCFE